MSGLIKQIVDVLFNQGIDRKTDERLVVPGKLTRLDDAVFDSSNVIRRRNGYSSVALTALNSGTAVSGAKALHRVGDEMLIEADSGLHSCLEDGSGNKRTRAKVPEGITGTFRRAAVDVREVAAGETDQHEMDCAFGGTGSVSVWVWTELQRIGTTSRQVRWLTYDEVTKTQIATGTIGSATDDYFSPRVICKRDSGNDVFDIYFMRNAGGTVTVRHRRIAGTNLTTVGSETAIVTIAATRPAFDVVHHLGTDRTLLVAKTGAGLDDLYFGRLATDGYTVSATVSSGALGFEILSVSAFIGQASSVTYFHGIFHTGAGDVLSLSYSTDSLTTAVALTMATGLSNVGRVTSVVDPSDTTKFFAIYEHNSASANLTMRVGAVQAQVTGAAIVGVQVNDIARGVGIAAKPYAYASKLWLPVALLSAVQPTMFIVDMTSQWNSGIGPSNSETPFVLAKILPEEFGNLRGTWNKQARIPTSALSSYSAHIPCSRRTKLTYYKTTDVTVSVVADAAVDMGPVYDFAGTQGLSSCELNGLLFLAGAQPRFYDGGQWHEAGFNYFPEISAAASGGGSMTPSTTIGVTAVYEWYDAKGRRHQSAPAVPVSVALGGGDGSIDLTVSTLRLTDKLRDNTLGVDRGVRIIPYRTKSNGTVYYRTQGASRTTEENVVNVDTVTLDLSDADTDLASGELLYTTGNILEADAYEPCRIACTHQERLFMAGLQDPYEIRYTEQDLRVDRVGPSTNTVYTIRVPEVYGKITALASLDDKLVATCERGIYYFGGEGANRLGLQATFSPAICASSLFGHRVNEPGVLITTPDGLWFHAKDGFRFLNRGMQVQRNADGTFMGSEVDSYADAVCHRATAAPAKRQVRFYMASAALVYDYQYGQWSRFTNQTNVDAAVNASGNFVILASGALYEESASTYTDNGTVIAMLAETGWLKLAGLQGFERVYRVKVLGTFESTATLQLEVAYDYSSTYQTPVSMTTGSVFSVTPVQAEHHLPKQKCEAVRFRITDTNTAAGGGTRSLIGLALQVGVKKGFFKTPSGQRM